MTILCCNSKINRNYQVIETTKLIFSSYCWLGVAVKEEENIDNEGNEPNPPAGMLHNLCDLFT